MAVRRLVTAEELEQMGEQDFGFELVRGELVPVSPAGEEHGRLVMRLAARLATFVEAHGLGVVYAAETGFVLARNPDTVRGPDVSFVRRERFRQVGGRRGFVPGAPDLAVEVRSPDNTLAELAVKAADYLSGGARLVWIVDPRRQRVYVHRPGRKVEALSLGDALDGGEVISGFRLPLSDLFADPV